MRNTRKRERVATGIYKRIDAKGEIIYDINFRDEFGKNKFLKVGRKSDGVTVAYCKQYRSKIINMKYLGEDVSNIRKKSSITFDDITEDYFEYVKYADFKEPQSFANRYRDHIKDSLGHLPVESITKNDINNLIMLLKDKNLAPATIDRIRQQVSATFNVAIGKEKCRNNPASVSRVDSSSLMRLNKKSINNARERYLSKDEANLLLSELKLRRFDVYFMALLALTTGARAGEILKIQYKDIDLENRYINLVETKNGSSRKIKITSKVYDILNEIEFESPNKYLFAGSKHDHLQAIPNIYSIIVGELFNSELDSRDTKHRVCFHTLRHTFASWLAINGTPIFTIQKLMGHKDINMTLRYAKLSPDAGVEAVNSLEEKFIE
ncbi:tyrosine-type recombinase/integrase [Sulfurovum sp. NBC37-1]|uniref:tyrosine-type recombinase/integrase n=1 Tax=Sulfurovum sp. (strain NBC37-1) TaxID=387093 RepID=UPI000158797B|nr:site-specific integrase [Sulfurovum sp. NBC37-1]BAF73234.1 site-specific recombinase, phage integrase family [Sulfurovum sp. NBC37-1]